MKSKFGHRINSQSGCIYGYAQHRQLAIGEEEEDWNEKREIEKN